MGGLKNVEFNIGKHGNNMVVDYLWKHLSCVISLPDLSPPLFLVRMPVTLFRASKTFRLFIIISSNAILILVLTVVIALTAKQLFTGTRISVIHTEMFSTLFLLSPASLWLA